jgi:hypothetical protein
MKDLLVTLALLSMMSAAPAGAEVTSSGPGGFSIHHGVDVESTPAVAFQIMVAGISSWWLSDHTWSGDSASLSIDQRAGGCFCEQLPEGGSVEHMRVIFIQPGRLIRLQGGLGPLQEMGLAGTMTWSVQPGTEGISRIEWKYTVHGYLEGGFTEISAAVDHVLGQQLASLTTRLDR